LAGLRGVKRKKEKKGKRECRFAGLRGTKRLKEKKRRRSFTL
jgi:hypothetical protein